MHQRELDLALQVGAAGRLELFAQRSGEVQDGTGPDHGVARLGVTVGTEVEHALAAAVRLRAQLPTEVAQHEVGEVVGALVRA